MVIVIDTSAIIAVLTNEADRSRILAATQGARLLAPRSLHWEIGNAFSAMFKQRRITLEQAQEALRLYQRIPLQFIDVALPRAVDLAAQLKIYAYDAYILVCAQQSGEPLLSIDAGLLRVAQELGVSVIEI
jgi:predicted nucleic acid-binding protein